MPRTITVVLENDLVDKVNAGDDVVVVGILLRRWKYPVKEVRCDLETILKANSIRVKHGNTLTGLITDGTFLYYISIRYHVFN